MPAVTSLLGRESEVRLLGRLLDRVPDQGGALVVSGGPGIGKSALLGEARRRARDRGMLVLNEVLAAAALLTDPAASRLTVDVLDPAISAHLVQIDETQLRFRHPLMRTAIRQHASVQQRHAAHDALALALTLAGEPERAVWHRAASVIGPDEAVAGELEATALPAQRRRTT